MKNHTDDAPHAGADERDALRQELLEYRFGCHSDPTAIEARLESDSGARELLREVDELAGVLRDAAHETAPEIDMKPPTLRASSGRQQAIHPTSSRRRPARLALAAALLLFVPLLVSSGTWVNAERKLAGFAGQLAWFEVTGPSHVPAGAPAHFRVDGFDFQSRSVDASYSWRALDGDGRVYADGESTGDTPTIILPPRLTSIDGSANAGAATRRGPGKLEVTCAPHGREQTVTVDLPAVEAAPVVHLSSDKPFYRPGETAFLRAVILDRLQLESCKGRYLFKITDPKGSEVFRVARRLDEGVCGFAWQIAEHVAGGSYRLALRDSRDRFDIESIAFVVRDYVPPRLATTIDLDRQTYAPGTRGSAEITVERVEGGIPAGAAVRAKVVVDGTDVWTQESTLDDSGRCVLAFVVPESVERGDARFVATVDADDIVETSIEPFTIPTGKVEIAFYPEGGDLVAGVENRVYAEATDTLGRPLSARGTVIDERGDAVAEFRTEHQGRARFAMTPRAGASYRLRFNEPQADAVPLPDPIDDGIVLRATEERTGAGKAVRMRVHTPDAGPWTAGVFCRGNLVELDRIDGSGWSELSFELPASIAGVLRVTLFDDKLVPRAERLIQREAAERIVVDVQPASDTLLPGDHQVLDITTRDERGNPVAAVIGLTVTDRAVRDMLGEPRIGIADQTWLLADVEDIEDIAEFLPQHDESPRNVDLLLGTRGWRRFVWHDPTEALADNEELALRLLAREGQTQQPVAHRSWHKYARTTYQDLRKQREAARDTAVALGGVGLLALLYLGVFLGLRHTFRGLSPAGAAGVSFSLLSLLVAAGLFQLQRSDRGAPGFLMGEAADAMPAIEAELPQERRRWGADERVVAAGIDRRLAHLGYSEEDVVAPVEHIEALGYALEDEPDEADQAEPGVQARPDVQARLDDVGYIVGADDRLRALGYQPEPLAYIQDFDVEIAQGAVIYYYGFQRVRVFAHKNESRDDLRRDFAETVYWNPHLRTSNSGTARVAFDVSDSVTTWVVESDAHGGGRIGQGRHLFESKPPFFLDAAMPVEVSDGDRLLLPVSLTSSAPDSQAATVAARLAGDAVLDGTMPDTRRVALVDGRGRTYVPLLVTGSNEPIDLRLDGEAGGWKDSVQRRLRTVPRGFPHHRSESGVVENSIELTVASPDEYLAGTLEAELTLYTSPLADLMSGLDGMVRTPYGCFEQASSANYPNILVLSYLEAAGIDEPAAARKARDLLEPGYQKLVAYECRNQGYEWFGHDPAHEALTAYGLLQFHDMTAIHDVDGDMLQRTRDWLLERRDGNGGFRVDDKALDSFGRAPAAVTDAYVTYALAATGQEPASISAELDRQQQRAAESNDPYEVALAAAALEHAGRAQAADAGRTRLKSMQRDDGAVVGTTTSITSSGSRDLAVETTAFAVLAWLADAGDVAHVERGVQFLLKQRRGDGTFGATQATIMALRALTAYARENREITNDGDIIVYVNDYEVERRRIRAGDRQPVAFDDFANKLAPGENRVRIEVTGGNELPFAFELSYHAEQPADDPDAAIRIATAIDATGDSDREGNAAGTIAEGDSVAVRVTVENATTDGVPMTIAVIGLPAGLSISTHVLDDLRDAGRFDFYELAGREIVLYWRGLEPRESRTFAIDTVASIPGSSAGPASRAWLYYTPDAARWAEPLSVRITPAERR